MEDGQGNAVSKDDIRKAHKLITLQEAIAGARRVLAQVQENQEIKYKIQIGNTAIPLDKDIFSSILDELNIDVRMQLLAMGVEP